MVVFFLRFKNKSPYCSPQWLYQFTSPPRVGSLSSTHSPAFNVYRQCIFFFSLRGLCHCSQNLTVWQPHPPRSLILSYSLPCRLLVFQTFLTRPFSLFFPALFMTLLFFKFCPLFPSGLTIHHLADPSYFSFLFSLVNLSLSFLLSKCESPNLVKSIQASDEHTGGNQYRSHILSADSKNQKMNWPP